MTEYKHLGWVPVNEDKPPRIYQTQKEQKAKVQLEKQKKYS